MKSVYFLDIDDCLIETSALGSDELAALKNALVELKIPKASEITSEFSRSFHRQYDHHQGKPLSSRDSKKLVEYQKTVQNLEKNIIARYGQVKKWSREVFLFVAAGKFGIRLKSGDIDQITVKLWKAITDHNPFYPDALNFLNSLFLTQNSFYLISASDCRLVYDDRKMVFNYDPEYSRKLKMQRLQKFMDLGIPPENIFIGDPYDKPDPWVFNQALEKAKADMKTKFHSVMVGDSVNNDLIPAAKIGMEELIFINRHKKKMSLPEGKNIKEIFSLSEIPI